MRAEKMQMIRKGKIVKRKPMNVMKKVTLFKLHFHHPTLPVYLSLSQNPRQRHLISSSGNQSDNYSKFPNLNPLNSTCRPERRRSDSNPGNASDENSITTKSTTTIRKSPPPPHGDPNQINGSTHQNFSTLFVTPPPPQPPQTPPIFHATSAPQRIESWL